MSKHRVTDGDIDPVFVEPLRGGRVELRIGESKRGQSRFALLSPAYARLVAYALLSAAERSEQAGAKV